MAVKTVNKLHCHLKAGLSLPIFSFFDDSKWVWRDTLVMILCNCHAVTLHIEPICLPHYIHVGHFQTPKASKIHKGSELPLN